MINDDLIAATARGYCEATYGTLTDHPFIAEGFRQGAKWAQKEFVNSLWRNAKEKPKEKGYIITKYFDLEEKEVKYELDFIQELVDWKEYTNLNCIMEWCYISDILPKKGGEE